MTAPKITGDRDSGAEIYELASFLIIEFWERLKDQTTRFLLAESITKELPNIKDVTNDQLLQLIGGFPGVIDRWFSDTYRPRMKSLSDLESVAKEAHRCMYGEFDTLFPSLSKDELKLAIRLAFFPRLDHHDWDVFKEVLLHELNHELLFLLQENNVLEGEFTYGHDTRHIEARRWFLRRYRPRSEHEIDVLLILLACRVNSVAPNVRPFVEALVWFASHSNECGLNDTHRAIASAALSLFPDQQADASLHLLAERCSAQREPRIAPLISMSLVNGYLRANHNDDVVLRDALLEGLRHLHQALSQDLVVREKLANGLFNALNDANQEDNLALRDDLLKEMRELSVACPQDTALHEWLAKAIFNSFVIAEAEQDRMRRDKLLEELYKLHLAWPEEPAVRRQLAIGLVNMLVYAAKDRARARRDDLFKQLYQLHYGWPQDAAVREWLAKGLFNTLSDVRKEYNLARRDALLEELRQLYRAWPMDPAVREWLASGLYNTLIDAKEERDLVRSETLLDELVQLYGSWPQDSVVRQYLAGAKRHAHSRQT
jgi:hypothetical protein